MTEDDIIQFVAGLPGVLVVTANEADGAPEMSWGDSFFYYDPEGGIPVDRRLPFATIVTKDLRGIPHRFKLESSWCVSAEYRRWPDQI